MIYGAREFLFVLRSFPGEGFCFAIPEFVGASQLTNRLGVLGRVGRPPHLIAPKLLLFLLFAFWWRDCFAVPKLFAF